MSRIYNKADNTVISGNGNLIKNWGDNVTIGEATLAGDDFGAELKGDNIENNIGYNVKIYGSTFCDRIDNLGGCNVTIVSGASHDSIENDGGQKVRIFGKSGDDLITNLGGSDVKIYGGYGADSIRINYDFYGDYGRDITVSGGDNNDTVQVFNGYNIKINGDTGDDILENRYSSKVTINGGAGNDSIRNGYDSTNYNDYVYRDSGNNNLLMGGTGNDSIENRGSNVTISGGKGNDYISLSPPNYIGFNVIRYASGDGNDTVFGFNSLDTLQITKGNYSTKVSGDDVIVTVGKGKIILKDTIGQDISIMDSSGKVTSKKYSSNVAELFEEDNFATASNISEIIAEKSVGEFENYKTENKQENLITFAK